jgi:PAS domain S-box-containing protein
MDSTYSPIFDTEKKCTHILFSAHDITERKRVEEELLQSEKKYQELYDYAPDMYFTVSSQGVVLSVNQFGADHLGYTKEELIGKAVWSVVCKDDLKTIKKQIAEIISSKILETEIEFRKVRKDGSIIWVSEKIKLIHSYKSDEPDKLFIMCRDITKSKTIHYKLKENEELLKKAQEIAHIGSWKLDIKTDELFWSEEVYKIFGIDVNKTITHDVFKAAVHPDDRENLVEGYKQAWQNHETYDFVHRIIRPDGTIRFVREKSQDVADETGEAVLSIGMVHDITEQVQSENDLQNALTEKETLLKEAQHRIKNNLAMILSLISLQIDTKTDTKSLEKFEALKNQIGSILTVYEMFCEGENISNLDFSKYSHTVLDMLFSGYNLKDVKIAIDIEDVFLDISVSIPLGLIINELTTNAIKYGLRVGKKDEFSISLKQDRNKNYVLRIKNTGNPIPDDIDFKNTESLGLRLVCIFTQQLKGEIELNKNLGTEFIITFPIDS